MLTACNNQKQEQLIVYSFYGENECFEISNGTIVLSDSEDVFYGGNLQVNQPEAIQNITSYKATFYTMIDGQQETILIDELHNISSTELLGVDLGKKVSNNPEISNQFKNIEEANGKFWCELKVTDTEGINNSYKIELNLIKIS
jgi:hypothetical protein